MNELIAKAIETLNKSNCNEVELADTLGNKVRLIRVSPIPVVYTGQWWSPTDISYKSCY